jgi:hypothetical protein
MLKPVPEPQSQFALGVKVELSRSLEDQVSELAQTMQSLTVAIGEFMARPPYTVVQPQAHGPMKHTFIRDEQGRVTGAIVEPYDG